MHEELRPEVTTLTPTYMGGPNQEPEIRVPSIKGLLRFWYRAIDPDYRSKEGMVFGDAGNSGVSSFKMQIHKPAEYRKCHIGQPQQGSSSEACIAKNLNSPGIDYLTFPFRMRGAGRDAIAPNQRIVFRHLFSKTTTSSPRWPVVKRALIIAWWGLAVFGGFGARSRRGFGSFMITDISPSWNLSKLLSVVKEKKSVQSWWQGLLSSYDKIKSYVGTFQTNDHLVLSPGTRILLLGRHGRGFGQWEFALDYFGEKLKDFRSGHSIERKIKPEEKAAFGLPIVGSRLSVKGKDTERSASPILARVVRIGGEYYVLVLLTKSPVLPPGEKVIIEKPGRRYESHINSDIIDEFYEDLSADSVKERTIN